MSTVTGIFGSMRDAQSAVESLRSYGFDSRPLNVLAPDDAGRLAAGVASADLRNEELYFLERALRRDGSVLVMQVDGDDQETQLRNLMERAGGRPVQNVRREWWQQLRDGERLYFHGDAEEADYRAGFEAALHPATRGRGFDEVIAYVETCYPEPCRTPAFRAGYGRGQQYFLNGYRWPAEAE